MDISDSKPNSKRQLWFLYGVLVTLVLSGALAALIPSVRTAVRQALHKPYRSVLSTVTADIFNDGKSIKLVKIKTDEGLFVEVYGDPGKHARPLIDKIKLPDQRDGFFHYRGQATNLAANDVDGDNVLEILAPSFDQDFVAHLNVYRYSQDSGRFLPYNPNP